MRDQQRWDLLAIGLPACASVAVVLWLGASWPETADQLVYAQQAASGDLSTRTVHVGWIALLAMGGSGVALLLSALSAAVVVVGASLLRGGARPDSLAAWVALAALLPVAGVLEVDLLCAALVVLAALDRSDSRSAVWLALGLLVSPTGLLAVPWLFLRRSAQGTAAPVVAALGLWLGAVTAVGGSDWLLGERGLLAVPSWRLRPVWWAWVQRLPWLALGGVVVFFRERPPVTLLGVLPLLLAPSDVPVQCLATVMVLADRPRLPSADRALTVLAALQLAVSGLTTHDAWRLAQERQQELQLTASGWGHGDVAVAPWSVGVELSWMVSGDAYGVPWRSERGVLPRQEARWCEATVERVHVWRHGRFDLREPSDPEVVAWLGCPPPLR